MPTPADVRPPAAVVAYYRAVGSTLLTHLTNRSVQGYGREVHSADGSDRGTAVDLHIADVQDLDESIRSGITCFRLPGLTDEGLVSLRVRPGEASGIDTVATAALALATSMSRDGFAATAMTDGVGGLYLIGFAVGPVARSPVAHEYAAALCARAPEIATTDASDAGGRALVQALPREGSRPIPAPYSLVAAWNGQGVAAPLTMDEVAAASAGMPLEIEPADVPGRLVAYGDLAAALGEATTLPA